MRWHTSSWHYQNVGSDLKVSGASSWVWLGWPLVLLKLNGVISYSQTISYSPRFLYLSITFRTKFLFLLFFCNKKATTFCPIFFFWINFENGQPSGCMIMNFFFVDFWYLIFINICNVIHVCDVHTSACDVWWVCVRIYIKM